MINIAETEHEYKLRKVVVYVGDLSVRRRTREKRPELTFLLRHRQFDKKGKFPVPLGLTSQQSNVSKHETHHLQVP